MPLERIYRDISVRDSKNLDSFSKTRISEPSEYSHLDFRYMISSIITINLDNTQGYLFDTFYTNSPSNPSIGEFSSTNNSFILKNTNVSGFGITEVRSKKKVNIVPYSTVHAYISFRLENLTPLVSGNYIYVGLGSGANPNVTEIIHGFIGLVVDVTRATATNPQGYSFQVSRTSFSTSGQIWIGRDSWNDKLDGSGSSGINIDFTKVQVLAIKYETSRSGSIRIGFMIGGKFIEAIQFIQTNGDFIKVGSSTSLGNSATPFWSSCVVVAGGTFTVATTPSVNILHCYGGVSFREESPKEILPSNVYSYSTSHRFPVSLSAGVTSAILGIRSNSLFSTIYTTRIKSYLSKVNLLSLSSTPFYWEIVYEYSGTIAAYTTINARFSILAGKPSIITAKSSNPLTIYAGFCAANTNLSIDMPDSIKNIYELYNYFRGSSANSVVLTLYITPIGGTINANEVSATFTIEEIQN